MTNVLRSAGNYLNPVEFVPELFASTLGASICYASCCSSNEPLHNIAAGIGIVGGLCFGAARRPAIRYDYDQSLRERLVRGTVRSFAYVGALTLVEMLEGETKTLSKQIIPLLENGWKYTLGLGIGTLVASIKSPKNGNGGDDDSDFPEDPTTPLEEEDLPVSRPNRLRRFEPTLN